MKNVKHLQSVEPGGFTLIEILVALVLLSMTLLLLFSSLYTANQYWQIGEKKIEKNDEIRLVSHFIRRQVSQMAPILWIDKDKRRLLFLGKRDALQFTSVLPAHRGGGGLHLLTLKVRHSDSLDQLGLSYTLLTPELNPFAYSTDTETKFVAIANEVDSIKMTYFGQEKIKEGPRWFDEWENDERLPQLVRIEIQSKNNNKNWPTIDIPIQTTYMIGQPEFIIKAGSSL